MERKSKKTELPAKLDVWGEQAKERMEPVLANRSNMVFSQAPRGHQVYACHISSSSLHGLGPCQMPRPSSPSLSCLDKRDERVSRRPRSPRKLISIFSGGNANCRLWCPYLKDSKSRPPRMSQSGIGGRTALGKAGALRWGGSAAKAAIPQTPSVASA